MSEHPGDALSVFAELLADLRSHVAWQAATGARVVHAESEGLVALQAVPNRVQHQSVRSPPEERRPRPSGSRTGPGPRRGVPAAKPQGAAPVRQKPQAPVAELGRWSRYAKGQTPPAPAPDGPASASAGSAPKRRLAQTLSELQQMVGPCTRCGLCAGRENLVFGAGDARARLMVVGEGPGQQEDQQGLPFVGKSGQMLERMLVNVLGLAREQVYITNVVKCRPPDNRNPDPAEIAKCAPILRAQMRIIRPKVVLALGSVAARAVFDTQLGVTRLRGQWRTLSFEGGQAAAMATFHPAYLLRRPEDKGLTFQDLKAVAARLAGPDPE